MVRRAFLLATLLLTTVLQATAQPLRIIATGDMHGWLQATQLGEQWLGGAAEMLGYWKQVEGYQPEQFLVLSCGDIATGPAISTIFQGDPVIAAMNLMGYDASVLGNHDFDFKRARFEQWRQEAKFPFLAANLVDADRKPSDLTVPYFLYQEQGITVAVVGLIMRNIFTFGSTDGLTARPYAEVLHEVVPEVRKQGAQVVIVATHMPFPELQALAGTVTDLNIPLMLGAHDHEFMQRKVGETWVVNSGLWWRGYSRIDLNFNDTTGKAAVISAKQVWLLQDAPQPDAALQAEITRWQQRISDEYGVPLGYTVSGLRRPNAVYNFVTDAWLAMDTQADIALTNDGSMRQDIAPGAVSYATLAGLMPFNNSLLRLSLTGEQLQAYLPRDKFIGMAGISRQRGTYLLKKTGKPIEPRAIYQVLVNDYMYNDNRLLRAGDRTPETVSDDWRQPVHDWLLAHPTTDAAPLESLVDITPRITP